MASSDNRTPPRAHNFKLLDRVITPDGKTGLVVEFDMPGEYTRDIHVRQDGWDTWYNHAELRLAEDDKADLEAMYDQ